LRQRSLQGFGFFGVQGFEGCVHEKLLENQWLTGE
jgi:hypothetical protein